MSDAFAAAREAAPDEPSRARCWYEEGCYHEARGLRVRAVNAFEQVTASPDPGPVLVASLEHLGRLHQRAGDVEKALAVYDRVLEVCADQPPVVEQVLMVQVRLWRQAGNPARAAAAARRLLDLAPAGLFAADATNALADLAVQSGDWEAARKLALAEAARPGGDHGLLLRVGLRLRQAGRLADALALLEPYSADYPDDESALQTLFELHQEAGSLEAYLRALQAAATRPETRVSALRRLADAYTRQQDHARALEALEELLKLTPEATELHARAGYAATAAGKLDAARAHLSRALELEPESSRLQSDLGDVYARQGDLEKALALWKLAADYDPANLASARLLARRLLSRSYSHHALTVLQEALATWRLGAEPGDESNPLALEMGQAYEAELELAQAVDCYLLVLRQGSDDPAGAAAAETRLRSLLADGVAGPVALKALETALREGQAPDAALAALAAARLNLGDAPGANQALLQIADPARRCFQVLQIGGELVASGQPGRAAALYEAALTSALPAELAARLSLRLAQLQREAGRWRLALAALEAAPAQPVPDSPMSRALKLAAADILVAEAADPGRARALYAEVAARPDRPELAAWARWGLADCAFAAGDYADAAARYRALAAEAPVDDLLGGGVVVGPFAGPYGGSPVPDFAGNPRDPGFAALRLAEITFRTGDMAAARAAFLGVAQTHAASESANDALARVLLVDTALGADSPGRGRYLQALGLLDRGDLEGALQHLDLIASTGPEDPLSAEAALLAARSAARLGEAQEGLRRLEALATTFAQSPLAPAALLEAARLAADLGEAGGRGARELCQSLTERYPTSTEAVLARELLQDLARN